MVTNPLKIGKPNDYNFTKNRFRVYCLDEMMKKVILTILMLSLCACSSGAESTAEPSASAADSFSEFFDTVEDYQGDFCSSR